MSSSAVAPRPVLADLVPGALLRDAALIGGGAGLVGLSAQFSITVPQLSPVPFTLQTLAVLTVAAALGPARAVLSMVLYLLAGLAGLPWFAGHASGWHFPSFGYLLGFVGAAGLVGELARRRADRHVLTTAGLMIAGTAVIYLFGASWLAVDLHLSAGQAWALGVRPFLISDVLKMAVAALAFPGAWKLVQRYRSGAS
jgi:biotin transport system substrate-specific component